MLSLLLKEPVAGRGRVVLARMAAMVVACCAVLLPGFITARLVAVLPAIAGALGATASEREWLADVALVVPLGLFVVGSALVAWLGRRFVLLGGIIILLAGLGACASVVATAAQLIAALSVVGVGLGLTLAAGVDAVADRLVYGRLRWVVSLGCYTVGLATGWIAGGLVSLSLWRQAFQMDALVVGALLVAAALVASRRDLTRRARPTLLSVVVLTVAVGAVILVMADRGVAGFTENEWPTFFMVLAALALGYVIGGLRFVAARFAVAGVPAALALAMFSLSELVSGIVRMPDLSQVVLRGTGPLVMTLTTALAAVVLSEEGRARQEAASKR